MTRMRQCKELEIADRLHYCNRVDSQPLIVHQLLEYPSLSLRLSSAVLPSLMKRITVESSNCIARGVNVTP